MIVSSLYTIDVGIEAGRRRRVADAGEHDPGAAPGDGDGLTERRRGVGRDVDDDRCAGAVAQLAHRRHRIVGGHVDGDVGPEVTSGLEPRPIPLAVAR